MLKTKNRIEITGEVSGFKIKDFKTGNGKYGDLTIHVVEEAEGEGQKKNSYIKATLFNRDSFKFGDVELTLTGLQNRCLDEDGKTRNLKVSCVGSSSDFKTDKNVLMTSNRLFGFFQANEERKHVAIFDIDGFVSSANSLEDDDENTYLRIKLVTYSYRDSEKAIAGIEEKTVVVRDEELIEKLSDLAVGDFINVKGDIISTLPPKDKYHESIGTGIREFTVKRAKINTSAEEMNDKDVETLKKAKKLKKGELIQLKSISKEDEDLAKKIEEDDE